MCSVCLHAVYWLQVICVQHYFTRLNQVRLLV